IDSSALFSRASRMTSLGYTSDIQKDPKKQCLDIRIIYSREIKTSSLMIATSLQFTWVNGHFERIRRQRF
ncbi:MAG: hypothetical protein ABFQ95_06570, partial [Pseudomonadota bacterium]